MEEACLFREEGRQEVPDGARGQVRRSRGVGGLGADRQDWDGQCAARAAIVACGPQATRSWDRQRHLWSKPYQRHSFCISHSPSHPGTIFFDDIIFSYNKH